VTPGEDDPGWDAGSRLANGNVGGDLYRLLPERAERAVIQGGRPRWDSNAVELSPLTFIQPGAMG
jgi:hypothetical protein